MSDMSDNWIPIAPVMRISSKEGVQYVPVNAQLEGSVGPATSSMGPATSSVGPATSSASASTASTSLGGGTTLGFSLAAEEAQTLGNSGLQKPLPKRAMRSQACLARPMSTSVKIQTRPVFIQSMGQCRERSIQTVPVYMPPEVLTRSRATQTIEETNDELKAETQAEEEHVPTANASCQTKKVCLRNKSIQTEETDRFSFTPDNIDTNILQTERTVQKDPTEVAIDERAVLKKVLKSSTQKTELTGAEPATSASREEIVKVHLPPTKRLVWSMHVGTQTDQPDLRGTYAEKAIYILKSVEDFRQHFVFELKRDSRHYPILHIIRADLYGKLGWEGNPLESVLTNDGTLTHRVVYLPSKRVKIADEHGDLLFDALLAELRWLLSIRWFCPGIDCTESDKTDGHVDIQMCYYPEPRWMDKDCPVVMVSDQGKRRRCSFCEHKMKGMPLHPRQVPEPLSFSEHAYTEDDARYTKTSHSLQRKRRPAASRTRIAHSKKRFRLSEDPEVFNEDSCRQTSSAEFIKNDEHVESAGGDDSIMTYFTPSSSILLSDEEHESSSRSVQAEGKNSSGESENHTEMNFKMPLLFQTSADTDDIPLD